MSRPCTPTHPMYLMIVRRNCEETFDHLEETFGSRETVQVVWDRRSGDRRTRCEVVESDRRRADRRQGMPRTWDTIDFLVVRAGSGGDSR